MCLHLHLLIHHHGTTTTAAVRTSTTCRSAETKVKALKPYVPLPAPAHAQGLNTDWYAVPYLVLGRTFCSIQLTPGLNAKTPLGSSHVTHTTALTPVVLLLPSSELHTDHCWCMVRCKEL